MRVHWSSIASSCLLLAFGLVGDAAADGPVVTKPVAVRPAALPAGWDNGDDGTSEVVRDDVELAKLKPFVKDDPRVAALQKELIAARAIADKAARKKRLEALAPKMLELRADLLKKAGIDGQAAGKRLAQRASPTVKTVTSAALSGQPLGTLKITSFPKTYGYRKWCPDDRTDKWDFDGASVRVFAESSMFDDDCTMLRAGRLGTFTVPTGARRMRVQVAADVELEAGAASLASYGKAWVGWGLMLYSRDEPLGTVDVNGKTFAADQSRRILRNLGAKNHIPNPIPFDISSFSDSVQEGDERSYEWFELQTGWAGRVLELGIYIEGGVDADLTGYAWSSSKLTPKSLTVTFYAN